MKAKIIEIAQKHFGSRMFDDIILAGFADEIIALFDGEPCMLCNLRAGNFTEHPFEEKKHLTAEDCDCRHCQPELWILDTDRDIWIKKA